MRQVSPELVLVDSLLASSARALLPDPPDTLARAEQAAPLDEAPHGTAQVAAPTREPEHLHEPEPERPANALRSPFPFSFPDNGRFLGVREAEQRTPLAECVSDSEVGGDVFRSLDTHFRRATTLVPASATAGAVALFSEEAVGDERRV
jgi:hypothetical protein